MAMELSAIVAQTIKGYDKVDKTDASPSKKGKAAKTAPQARDSVRISDEAKLFGAATEEARNAPDVRQQKVAELKAKVQSGQYEPDLRRTAAKIVEEDLNLLI